MCTYSAGDDGVAVDWHLIHLVSRAAGGAGIVFTEAASVTPGGRITDGDLGIWNDTQAAALARIASRIREFGAIPGVQLAHAGRKGGRMIPWKGSTPIPTANWGPLFAPSAIPFHDGWNDPVAMSTDDVDAVVVAFASAARRAAESGFLAIELHYAHGYLVHQFLTPLVNQRVDEYGGSLENRARLAVRIARAVRAAVGDSIALFARLSVVDWADGGLTLDDAVAISRWLADAGVDLIDCSSGAAVAGERVPAAPHYLVGFAERIRADGVVKTAAVGLITDARDADEIIRDGRADITMIGRGMLRDPYWARAAARTLGAVADPPIPLPYRRAVERMDAPTPW